MKDKLLISENFFSIQGEGLSSGTPSYFIRLANCNLTCGFFPKEINTYKKQDLRHLSGNVQGELHKQGLASWTCDSAPVWARGEEKDFEYLISTWKYQNLYKDVKSGLIHIIWTGGEPTIPMHQTSITGFIRYWQEKSLEDPVNEFYNPYYEIETNGTIYIEDELFNNLNQINCSAKLSNSGMDEKKRIVPKSIERIKQRGNYQFKFVISTEQDIKEMFDTYILPFSIPLNRVVCMPGMDSQYEFHERTKFIMEMAKKYKFIGLTRLHLSAWDKATGV